MIRSFPPHPNPLPPGERGGHSSPQQSWGVFWHILIKFMECGLMKIWKGSCQQRNAIVVLEKINNLEGVIP